MTSIPSPRFPEPEILPPPVRRTLAAGVAAIHVAAGWALWQIEPVRAAIGDIAPVFVEFLAAPATDSARPVPRPSVAAPVPTTRRLLTTEPAPGPVRPAFVAPPAPAASVDAPAPAPAPPVASATTASAAPAPAAAPAAIAAPAPTPAPSEPRTIAIGTVRYLTTPVLEYPPLSRRQREEGLVHVRVLVDARGLPQQAQLVRSSGYPRLDDAALAAVRAARFSPYTENDVPLPFRVVVPLLFELEN